MALKPIPLFPAYRSGALTPWGGEGLKKYFGKDIPDERTGEALEMSVIKGLNSVDDRGTPLQTLIDQLGEQLTGTAVKGEFPLLLKLLNAKDRLSVQVHPDDTYAAEHENKLGKTEAWVILHAEEGAGIIYGVKEGVTREELMEASLQGAAIEKLLRFVPVKAGETYFIPAGMVHAIGEGITLYEIQQSSDVTYRFYDWERTDAQGNKRQLHLKDAIAVTDIKNQGKAVEPRLIEEGRYELLHNPHFTTERWVNREAVLPVDTRRFAILTALGDTTLCWEDGSLQAGAGQSIMLPADLTKVTMKTADALISYPTVAD